jgi:hypothetical protein
VAGKSWSLDRSWIHTLFLDAYFEDALTKMRADTGLGSTFSLFIALNEYFYEHGYMEEKGYIYHKQKYSQPLVQEFEHRLTLENESKELALKQKELEAKKLRKPRPNYSKMSISELQQRYNVAENLKDHTAVQLISYEFKKRGTNQEVP